MWSQNAPVTLFGAAQSGSGWDQIVPVFNWLATRFSHCQSFRYEVIAAGVSGDLGYLAGIEHTVASLDGAVTKPYSLRVTTILRREDCELKVVHRHADPLPESEGAGSATAASGRFRCSFALSASFSQTTPPMMTASQRARIGVRTSSKKMGARRAAPTAPMPAQTA